MEITLENAKIEGFDRHGHYGQPGRVIEETLELRNVGTGIDAFTVVMIAPNGRVSEQVPPTTSEDAYAAFELMKLSSVPGELR